MTTYSPPNGLSVEFTFLNSGYIAPVGDAVNFSSFINAYSETCEDGFDLADDISDYLLLPDFISDEFQCIDELSFYITCFHLLIESLNFSEGISSLLIAKNVIALTLNISEQLSAYIPSGVIQLILNPFVINEIESPGVLLTQSALVEVSLNELEQTKILLTEVLDSVILTEVL